MTTQLQALLGLSTLLLCAWALSENRRQFPWRSVIGGLGLQAALAWLFLRTELGATIFGRVDEAFRRLLSFANEGTALVFGPIANEKQLTEKWGPGNGFVFAVSIVGTIVLISALSSLLYHWGWLQRMVRLLALIMRRVMGTSGSESLAAAANIFMGQTEAPLVIKPYLASMSRSEFMALMVTGMATIAGSVLAAYVQFGISASHLLCASVMSAPAALMFAKIMIPEDRNQRDLGENHTAPTESINSMDAICHGAADGMQLAIRVMAMVIALMALVALANALLGACLNAMGLPIERPLQSILGWTQAPLAWLMGIAWVDCQRIGELLGERIILNEFIAYLKLSQAQGLQPQSVMIATYALCGFANLGSIAIQIGGIGALVPERRRELAQLGMRAMVAGLLACYSTACVAGLMSRA
jgi:CNT family concentrative nucleoside transporter